MGTFCQISGDIPDASPDRHSIRSPTPSYVDPSVPGMISCFYAVILISFHLQIHYNVFICCPDISTCENC
jgi:hypothetical protein